MREACSIILFFLIVIFNGCNGVSSKPEIDISHLKSRSAEAKRFCIENNLDSRYYFLIDLARHSGLKRFYVWDLENDKIIAAFLVSHGCGDNPWSEDLSRNSVSVSNVIGSHKSSVGKYVIGERGFSEWGIGVKYLLHGKDLTNSNALRRNIVLHSWDRVPDKEIYPRGTPEGWGCPAISNKNMRIIDNMLQDSDRKVLLWIIK
ncbi:MAG: murein L,D-transpeptidase catalytic domain-containing protein [Bacteroidales bacterium]|jgi:hypothetical protein